MIYSDKVNNGGASRREMELMRKEKDEGTTGGRLSKRISNRMSGRVQDWDDGSEKYYEAAALSRQSTRRGTTNNRSSRRYGEGEMVERVPSTRSSRRMY